MPALASFRIVTLLTIVALPHKMLHKKMPVCALQKIAEIAARFSYAYLSQQHA
jgi:hypothetical protein